jgi:hypothetical protein
MNILSLMFLTLMCININFHYMQVKDADKHMKNIENELPDEYKEFE